LLVFIASCNVTKRIPEGEYLLEKNTITVNDKKISSPEIYSYLNQKPNVRVAGIPFSLHLYNFGNPEYDTIAKKWPTNKPKLNKKLTKTFSLKQVKALERSATGLNNWFIRSGNAPVISDVKKIEKSTRTLERYYFNNGFWDAEVNFKENKKKDKRVEIDYMVSTKEPYFLDTISTQISSPILDSLYKKNSRSSFVVQGDQYKRSNFENEEDRLVNLFRNSGVYRFGKDIMGFDIPIDTTTHKQNVKLKIPDRIIEVNDSTYTEPYKIQKVKNINVYTDFSFNTKDQKPKDSASYNGINFYALDKLKYNPKYLSNSIIIKPNGIYKDSERDFTRNYLRELQNFKPSIEIKYIENKDESLTANIYLTPLKKYTLEFDAEFTTSIVKPFGILGKFSFLNRNVFKGAEILELSFQGSFLHTNIEASNNAVFFDAYEIGTGANLKIPRILFPFKTSKIIPKRMAPHTNVGVSIGVQQNIGLDRQNITGGIDYSWKSSKTTNHKFELLNVQYIRNTNVDNYFNVYRSEARKLDSIAFGGEFNNIAPTNETLKPDPENPNVPLEPFEILPFEYLGYVLNPENEFEINNPEEFRIASNVGEQRSILIEDVLVPVISYAFNYNNRDGFKDNSFSTFTGRLISSGSLTSAFLKKPTDGSKKETFGLPVAQYLKTELEYKKYWSINFNSSLVFRQFIGMAVPFGNSDDIPFSRSYRAGGSNDIRAWQTFDLGPGSEASTLEFNTGSLKLTSNFEYRFKVLNSLKGALFIDAGNIWDITNSSITTSEAKFRGIDSIKDIAIGSGFGARYDFGFLIFRVDAAFKTYEPYNLDSKKWFRNYNFNKVLYNLGINYPF
jgi:outer membrane protein assembly factor BamA